MRNKNWVLLITFLFVLIGILLFSFAKFKDSLGNTNTTYQNPYKKAYETPIDSVEISACVDTTSSLALSKNVISSRAKVSERWNSEADNQITTSNVLSPKTVIKGRVRNAPRRTYPLTYQNLATLEKDTLGIIKLSRQGEFFLEVEVNNALQVVINFSEKGYSLDTEIGIVQLFIQPHDTISFYCDLSKPEKLLSGKMTKQTIRFDSANIENKYCRDFDRRWGGYAYSNDSRFLDYSPLEFSEQIARMETEDIKTIQNYIELNNLEKQYLKCQVKAHAYMSYRNYAMRKNADAIEPYFSKYIQSILFLVDHISYNSLLSFIYYDATWRGFEKSNSDGDLVSYYKYVEAKIPDENLQRIIQATAYRQLLNEFSKEQRKEAEEYNKIIKPFGFVEIGEQAPDWILPNVHGNSIRLSDLRSHVVLIEFWFPGCKSCLDAIPELNEIQEKYRPKGLRIFGLEFTQSDDRGILEYIERNKIDYSMLYTGGGVARKYGVVSAPTFLIIDRTGIIRYRKDGFLKEEIINEIDKLF